MSTACSAGVGHVDPQADPADGLDLPNGPIDVRFSAVHFAYPAGVSWAEPWPDVLSDIDLAIAAAAGWPWSARPAPARPRSPSCSPG